MANAEFHPDILSIRGDTTLVVPSPKTRAILQGREISRVAGGDRLQELVKQRVMSPEEAAIREDLGRLTEARDRLKAASVWEGRAQDITEQALALLGSVEEAIEAKQLKLAELSMQRARAEARAEALREDRQEGANIDQSEVVADAIGSMEEARRRAEAEKAHTPKEKKEKPVQKKAAPEDTGEHQEDTKAHANVKRHGTKKGYYNPKVRRATENLTTKVADAALGG